MGLILNRHDYLAKKIRVKEDDILLDLLYIPLTLHMMLIDFSIKAEELGMPTVVITRIIDDKTVFSKTDIHSEGRAIDIRSKEWPKHKILEIVKYMNEKYKDVGAIGFKSGEPHAVIYHGANANLMHFHLQIKPNVI